MNSGRMEDSSTELMHVEANANVNVTRFSMPKDPRELIVASLLALSIVVNVVCGVALYSAYKDLTTQKWLHDYDLEQFKAHEFAQLRNDVEVNKLMMAAQCGKPKDSL